MSCNETPSAGTRGNKPTTTLKPHPWVSDFPLEKIQLPEGFEIDIFASVQDARSLACAEDGTVYVGSRSRGTITGLRDTNADWHADLEYYLYTTGDMPNGIDIHNGDLYLAEAQKIVRFPNVLDSFGLKQTPEILYDSLERTNLYAWKYLRVGPDDNLYVSIASNCNRCIPANPDQATITRFSLEGKLLDAIAKGVKVSMGFDWHPETQEFWFTECGVNNLGNNQPEDELNMVKEDGKHYGFPYCHGGILPDPTYGKAADCSDFVAPIAQLGAHVVPLGMQFYTGDQFPAEYKNKLFILYRGGRNVGNGYEIKVLTIQQDKVIYSETFATGWFEPGYAVHGRLVDLLQLKDGSLLISDDYAGVIYRISHPNS